MYNKCYTYLTSHYHGVLVQASTLHVTSAKLKERMKCVDTSVSIIGFYSCSGDTFILPGTHRKMALFNMYNYSVMYFQCMYIVMCTYVCTDHTHTDSFVFSLAALYIVAT